jgi:ubiquinol-cytochrome c reductase cytochrome c1 subunit
MIARRFALALLLAGFAATPGEAQEAAASTQPGTATPARPVEVQTLPPRDGEFTFEGPFGTYDRAALQRGFQVYREVCSACHSLNYIAFRNLADEGGPGLSADQVRALAAAYRVPAGPNEQGQTVDANGQPLMRPATPSDRIPPPFPNEQAARASNNGAFPPDLSLIEKARIGGANYVYSVLTGYGQQAPAGLNVGSGRFFNPYFRGGQISMPPPLNPDAVTYADGTAATVEQQAHDVSTFLAWAADPKMEERKRTGFSVIIFLIVLTSLLYFSYQRVWYGQH